MSGPLATTGAVAAHRLQRVRELAQLHVVHHRMRRRLVPPRRGQARRQVRRQRAPLAGDRRRLVALALLPQQHRQHPRVAHSQRVPLAYNRGTAEMQPRCSARGTPLPPPRAARLTRTPPQTAQEKKAPCTRAVSAQPAALLAGARTPRRARAPAAPPATAVPRRGTFGSPSARCAEMSRGAAARRQALPPLHRLRRLGHQREIWGDMGRYGESWGDVGRCGEIWGDLGRYGELWGDMG